MQTTYQHDLPDALIRDQQQDAALQPGQKFRWGSDLERFLSRPQSQKDQPREYGLSFVGGWLSFVGQLTRA